VPREVDFESHEEVVSRIVEQGMEMGRAGRLVVANSNLAYLNSDKASLEYGVASLAYLRKVWKDVRERWAVYESDADREAAEFVEDDDGTALRADA
jgi:hypothetical protein